MLMCLYSVLVIPFLQVGTGPENGDMFYVRYRDGTYWSYTYYIEGAEAAWLLLFNPQRAQRITSMQMLVISD